MRKNFRNQFFSTIIQQQTLAQDSHPSIAKHSRISFILLFISLQIICIFISLRFFKIQRFSRLTLFSPWETKEIDAQGEKNLSLQTEKKLPFLKANFTQGKMILIDNSENLNNIFDRNLGNSEVTEPSEVCNEIEVISQRLAEQNNTEITQIEEQLKSKFEEILKEIRANRNNNLTADEDDAENNKPGPSYSENELLAPNTEMDL